MKKILLGCSIMLLISLHAQAQDFAASMKVIQAKDAFQKVLHADLRLTNESTMSIKLQYEDRDNTYDLTVFDIQHDEKGCTKYRARLRGSDDEERANGFWFFVDLVDYSSCDTQADNWQAFVRSGCRCCGLEDSTMMLSGKAQET